MMTIIISRREKPPRRFMLLPSYPDMRPSIDALSMTTPLVAAAFRRATYRPRPAGLKFASTRAGSLARQKRKTNLSGQRRWPWAEPRSALRHAQMSAKKQQFTGLQHRVSFSRDSAPFPLNARSFICWQECPIDGQNVIGVRRPAQAPASPAAPVPRGPSTRIRVPRASSGAATTGR
jgi:hypothetical protein